MDLNKTNSNIWWGPPRKFSEKFAERKISWLELFYDLVYVIAISKVTAHLSTHLNVSGLLDYTYLFIMIYWGWLNGSLHHDIHGSTGLRTNLMTLWQMIIVAGLVVTLNSPPEHLIFNATISIMVMQLYITYLWWSVGVYDKAHRKLNVPYTVCYLASLALTGLTLFVEPTYMRIIFYATLILNYLPPLLVKRNSGTGDEFTLSASMTERFGLFTIILFGEVVAGLIGGASAIMPSTFKAWLNFGLAVLIVFALWWIFFSMIADRKSKKGFLKSNFMALIYIPTLMSLGVIGVSFHGLFSSFENDPTHHLYWMKFAFGISLSIFLLGITALSFFLEYSEELTKSKRTIQRVLATASILFLIFSLLDLNCSALSYFLIILSLLLSVILIISKKWLRYELNKRKNAES